MALPVHRPFPGSRALWWVTCAAFTTLLAVALPWSSSLARADSHTLRDVRVARWTTAEGLPQNTVNDIVALPNGELWLATFGGLVRFDGAGFAVIDIARDPHLASNRITALVAAGVDALWFTTQEGHLGRLERGRVQAILQPDPRMEAVVGLVHTGTSFHAQAGNGDVWTSDGRRPWRLLVKAPAVDSGGTNFIGSTRSGRVWASFQGRVTELPIPSGSTPLPISGLAISGGVGDELWVGGAGEIGRLKDGQFERLRVQPALPNRVTAILPQGESQIWVGGGGLVSLLTAAGDGTWRRDDLPLDLPPRLHIRALAIDGEGSLWIGTNGRGLYRANRHSAQRFGEHYGIGAVAAVAEDGRGGVWASSSCDGIFHIDEADVVTHVYQSGMTTTTEPGGCEHAFAPAPEGALWLRWERHVYRVERAPLRLTRWPVELPQETGPVLARADGTLWVVSRGGDVRRISADRVLERHTLPPPLVSATLAPDGTLWVGGSAAIHEVRASGIRTLDEAQGVPRGSVRDILVSATGEVWMATYGGGLGVLRPGGVVRRLTTADGLPDNAISRLIDDGHGRVWMATNRGVAMLERQDVDGLLAGTRRTVAPVVLGAERGVPEGNFGLPAGAIDTRGRIWFGTIDGLVRIDAARFPFNLDAPAIRIDSVLADERALPLGPVVAIPPGTARVRLDFSAAALLYPERMRYRFRIEGIDRDWVDVGPQRFATFTPAGPGSHRFLLQARNEDGVWNTSPVVVQLSVLPAWWQTRGARLAGLVTVCLLALGLYRQRVGALERRHASRVEALEERRRAEERAAALRMQLEHVSRVALAGELAASLAHEVKQPLTAIVANAEAAQHVLAAGALADAGKGDDVQEMLHDIVSQGLRASEVITGLREFLRSGTPDDRPIDLSTLVREMLPLVRRELDDHAVRVVLVLADRLPPITGRRVQLGQVVVNLLMNACEAMAAQPTARQVTITTRHHDGRVEMTVADTGPGVAPDVADRLFEPFVTTKPDGMGMGLAICRSIAEAHRGRLTATAGVERGVIVTLSLPVNPPDA